MANTRKQAPVQPSAVKIANYLAGAFGGTRIRAYGESNPYAPHQFLDVRVPKGKVAAVASALEAAGYVRNHDGIRESARDRLANYDHASGARVQVGTDGFLSVRGTKRAKRLSVPYYD